MPGAFLSIKRIARVAGVSLLLGLTAQTDTAEPFGLATAAAPESPLADTWAKLQSQIKAEQPIIAQCRADPQSCQSAPAAEFIAIVDAGAAFEGVARIGHINRAANLAIRTLANGALDAIGARWTSPLVTLAAGAGDCKQFAVLKYAALEDAGVAPDDLRIVILRQRARPESHAVVAVRDEGRWLILDNRSLALVESSELLRQYAPLYSLDHRGARQFVEQPQVAQKSGEACAGSG
jgi:predicted transglutaminase-like cysteine proteinase